MMKSEFARAFELPKSCRRFWMTSLLTLLTATCISCSGSAGGPARYPVSGKVTLNSVAISSGSINFVPTAETKGPNSGTTINAGVYSIDKSAGLVPGKYTVEIRSQIPSGKKVYIGNIPLIKSESKYAEETIECVPPQYNRASTLRVEVLAKSNTLDFALEGEPEEVESRASENVDSKEEEKDEPK